MNKLVSIAMTTYNGENFLKEQLESIINQTYKNLEIIICDDCSTDNTINIIKDFQKRDKRIKLYQNEKQLGVLKNFEKAIFLCSGKYIALSDQDDIWVKNKIEIMFDAIGNYTLAFHDDMLIDKADNILFKSFWHKIGIINHLKDYKKLYINYYITGHSLFFKSSLKKNILPIPNDFYLFDLWPILIALKIGTVKQVDKPLVMWRQHCNNTSGSKVNKRNLFKKIFYPIDRDTFIAWNKHRIVRLKILLKNDLFKENKSFIEQLINYYSLENRLDALIFSIKNINLIVQEESILRKIKYLLLPLYAPKVLL